MYRFLLYLFVLLCSVCAHAAESTAEGIFSSRFKTLKVERTDNFMSPPVIRLGSDDRILITFDEIGEDNSYLQYRLVHCNSDWKPSQLVESEYVNGFNIADIDDYAWSANTFVHFVNYALEIPNETMRPLVSGNYLLQVMDRDEPDEVVLQLRFRVVENVVTVGAGVTSRTDRGVNDGWQQVSVVVDTDGFDVGNPYQDVKVEVVQNGRAEMSRFLKSPLRVDGGRIIYEHSPELLFPSGNEYRRFETVSTIFPGMRVDSMRYGGTNYHAYLYEDAVRADRNYSFDRTQHGRFIVREYNATDSNLGADYVTVHFTLDSEEIPGVDVYVDGEMTHGVYSDANRMTYDRAAGKYRLEMPLKQGAYNYQYVVREHGSGTPGSSSRIEGNKYETENEYNVYVYMRRPGERFDRLLGMTTVLFN